MIHDCDCYILQPQLEDQFQIKVFPFKRKKIVKTVTDWIINTAAGEGGRGGKWGGVKCESAARFSDPHPQQMERKKYFHKSQSTSPAEEWEIILQIF